MLFVRPRNFCLGVVFQQFGVTDTVSEWVISLKISLFDTFHSLYTHRMTWLCIKPPVKTMESPSGIPHAYFPPCSNWNCVPSKENERDMKLANSIILSRNRIHIDSGRLIRTAGYLIKAIQGDPTRNCNISLTEWKNGKMHKPNHF